MDDDKFASELIFELAPLLLLPSEKSRKEPAS